MVLAYRWSTYHKSINRQQIALRPKLGLSLQPYFHVPDLTISTALLGTMSYQLTVTEVIVTWQYRCVQMSSRDGRLNGPLYPPNSIVAGLAAPLPTLHQSSPLHRCTRLWRICMVQIASPLSGRVYLMLMKCLGQLIVNIKTLEATVENK